MKKKTNDKESFNGFEASPELQSELVDSTPRAAAIVGAAALEIQLERLLRKFLIDDKKEVDKLIDSDNPSAPLGNLSSKIRTCYCLGLIPRNEHDDLIKIKDIRNIFAHHINDCTFDESFVQKTVANFTIINSMRGLYKEPTRQRFTILVYTLTNLLKHRTQNIITKREVANEFRFG